MSNTSILLKNVCFSYDKRMILKHLSMGIEANRICFIMGNNGSGKTTLLKNIMGFLVPQTGEVFIQGKNIHTMDRRVMSKLISYVPQAIHLNTDFSVIDYLSFGRTPHLKFSSQLQKEDYETIERYSIEFGIDSIYDVPFNKLSGGQKQIVAITRSLIQDTPVIVMDEPMSALDIGKQVDFLKVMLKLTLSQKTIIITTHNPNHALAIDSDACFLRDGEIEAYGKSSSVISADLLHRIYGNNITLDHGEKTNSIVFETEALK